MRLTGAENLSCAAGRRRPQGWGAGDQEGCGAGGLTFFGGKFMLFEMA